MKNFFPPIEKLFIPALIITIISIIPLAYSSIVISGAYEFYPLMYYLLFAIISAVCIIGGILILIKKKSGVYLLMPGLLLQIIYAFQLSVKDIWEMTNCHEGFICGSYWLYHVIYLIILLIPFIWILQHSRIQYIKKNV